MKPLLETIHEAIHRTIPNLDGWVSPERGCELADLITQEQPLLCVEIGVFGGRSLISQALALREYGGKIYGIDPWRAASAAEGESGENLKWWTETVDLHAIHSKFMDALWRMRLESTVTVVRAQSQDCHDMFFEIDWFLLDGNHSEVASLRDVSIYMPKVREGGIIYMDDTDWPSTQKAVAMLDQNCELLKDSGKYRIYRKK